jgi:hypothetical protein
VLKIVQQAKLEDFLAMLDCVDIRSLTSFHAVTAVFEFFSLYLVSSSKFQFLRRVLLLTTVKDLLGLSEGICHPPVLGRHASPADSCAPIRNTIRVEQICFPTAPCPACHWVLSPSFSPR